MLAPSPTNTAGGTTRWIVVDGQQRLTTLSVLLCAIRDHVVGVDDQLAEKIHELHLVNKYAHGVDRYRLLPTQEDRASWIALVDRTPGAGGEDRIGSAYRYFRAKPTEFDDPDDDADVRSLEQTVTGRLALVSISEHADDNVHRIFESLNHKGQPLTQADLLRNYLFMRLPTRGDEVYATHWWFIPCDITRQMFYLQGHRAVSGLEARIIHRVGGGSWSATEFVTQGTRELPTFPVGLGSEIETDYRTDNCEYWSEYSGK